MQLSCSQRRRSQTYEVSAIRATCLLLISMYMTRVHPCCYMDIYIYIYKSCWFRGDCFNRPTRFQSTPRYLNISSSRDIYMYIHFGLGYLSVLRSFRTFQRVSRRFNKNRINVLLSKWKGKISFIALYFVRNLAGRIL